MGGAACGPAVDRKKSPAEAGLEKGDAREARVLGLGLSVLSGAGTAAGGGEAEHGQAGEGGGGGGLGDGGEAGAAHINARSIARGLTIRERLECTILANGT